jgi:hypothetical protein
MMRYCPNVRYRVASVIPSAVFGPGSAIWRGGLRDLQHRCRSARSPMLRCKRSAQRVAVHPPRLPTCHQRRLTIR